MNDKQKISPKYWIGHNKKSDDVIISTASKSSIETAEKTEVLFGMSWYDNEDIEVILIEVKEVEV